MSNVQCAHSSTFFVGLIMIDKLMKTNVAVGAILPTRLVTRLFLLCLWCSSISLAVDLPENLVVVQDQDQLDTLRSNSDVSVVLDVKSAFGKLFLENCVGQNEDATILLTDTPYVLIGNYLIGVGGLDMQNFQRVTEIETSSILGIKQGVIGKYSFSSTSMLRELLVAIQEGQAVGNLGDTKDVLVVWSKKSLDKLMRRNSVWRTARNLGYVTAVLFMGGLWYKLAHAAHTHRLPYTSTTPVQASTLGRWCAYVKGASPSARTHEDLVRSLQHADVFWPQGVLQLSQQEWVNYCTQALVGRYKEVLVNKMVAGEGERRQCSICLSTKPVSGGNLFQCSSCGGGALFSCNECLYDRLANNGLYCNNTLSCDNLLPYEVVRRACDGGIFNVKVENLSPEIRNNMQLSNQKVDEWLRIPDAVASRYLNQLVSKVAKTQPNLKELTCTQKACKFQALIERDTTLEGIPCYFHPEVRICVKCNANYPVGSRHRCRSKAIFESLEERRAADSMPCPHCGVETHRTGQCMHMTCSNCRHHWCWYCVWHYYGEEGTEAEAKRRAYATTNDYQNQHLDVYHDRHAFFFNTGERSHYGSHPYIKHCNLGNDCICKCAENTNPFLPAEEI